MSHLNDFLMRKFAAVSQLLKINLITVDSTKVVQSHSDIFLPKFLTILKSLQQERYILAFCLNFNFLAIKKNRLKLALVLTKPLN